MAVISSEGNEEVLLYNLPPLFTPSMKAGVHEAHINWPQCSLAVRWVELRTHDKVINEGCISDLVRV